MLTQSKRGENNSGAVFLNSIHCPVPKGCHFTLNTRATSTYILSKKSSPIKPAVCIRQLYFSDASTLKYRKAFLISKNKLITTAGPYNKKSSPGPARFVGLMRWAIISNGKVIR